MTDAERLELDGYRRQDLLRRMQTISRDQWAAGWKDGLEHDLYLMTFHGAPAEYGMSVIEPGALAELKRLAELTQVWWAAGPSAISLAEAEQRFSKLIATDDSGKQHSLSLSEAKEVYEHSVATDWTRETVRLPWDRSEHHAYRLKSNALFSLHRRDAEDDWELRFGDTTVAYVRPRWASVL